MVHVSLQKYLIHSFNMLAYQYFDLNEYMQNKTHYVLLMFLRFI